MFENLARLQATGGNFRLLTSPDVLHCLRLQQDCRQQAKIEVIEATSYFVICNKIAGNGGKFKSLRPPVLLRVVKIEQNSRQGGSI